MHDGEISTTIRNDDDDDDVCFVLFLFFLSSLSRFFVHPDGSLIQTYNRPE